MSENNTNPRKNNMLCNGQSVGIYNQAWISGMLEENFEYSHENSNGKYYKARVRVTRLSGTEDLVPMQVPESLLREALKADLKGKYVEVVGSFLSYNKKGEDGRRHLHEYLQPVIINIYDSEDESKEERYINEIYLEGRICKEPIFRITPLGRCITDLMLAVKRNSGKKDYIPCIAFGSLAWDTKEMWIGDKIKAVGRIQSREYFKRYSPESEEGEYRTTYEVCIQKILEP